MSVRIWNTTKKVQPRNAREKMGHMIHINDTLVGPGRYIVITDDEFNKVSSRLSEMEAAGDVRIEPLSNVSKEQVADIAKQVEFEKKIAVERAVSKGQASMTGFETKPKKSEQPAFDPNAEEDDMPFANTVDNDTMAVEDNGHADSFTVVAKNAGGVGKKQRGR